MEGRERAGLAEDAPKRRRRRRRARGRGRGRNRRAGRELDAAMGRAQDRRAIDAARGDDELLLPRTVHRALSRRRARHPGGEGDVRRLPRGQARDRDERPDALRARARETARGPDVVRRARGGGAHVARRDAAGEASIGYWKSDAEADNVRDAAVRARRDASARPFGDLEGDERDRRERGGGVDVRPDDARDARGSRREASHRRQREEMSLPRGERMRERVREPVQAPGAGRHAQRVRDAGVHAAQL
mmetsp:Transcript_9445/g.34360  ORF Transcript_9445/g.34360 Transcript_9445/m.34360 type:complete len:247 (+) Transcript_9445:445-1185(+)